MLLETGEIESKLVVNCKIKRIKTLGTELIADKRMKNTAKL